MPNYDYVTFTPQANAPSDPAKNEIYYKSSDDRLYICTDGTGSGGTVRDDVRLVEQSSPPNAARGRVYLNANDDHLYVCTAT